MNRNILSTMTAVLAGTIVLFTACNKDELKDTTDSKEGVLIYMPQAARGLNGLKIYPLTDEARIHAISASYGGNKYPDKDIAIKFEFSQTAFDSVNNSRVAAGLSPFEKFPADAYSIDNWDAVIRKGQSDGEGISIKYFAKKFNGQKNYLLPISIKEASGFSVNPSLNTTFLVVEKVEIKAGGYAATGARQNHNADGSAAGDPQIINNTKKLTKYINPSDPASLEFDVDPVANLAPGRAGTIFRLKVNADFSVTIYGQLDNPGQPIANAGAASNYDPASKTFTINYKYTLASGAYRQMTETLKLK